MLDFLYEFASLFESYYAAQLHRYFSCTDDRQAQLWEDKDPPF